VTFGGPSLGRLYVVSIGSDANNVDGALLVIDGLDTHGRAPNPAAPWIYRWYEMRRASSPRAWR
jgi:hypothetical protein